MTQDLKQDIRLGIVGTGRIAVRFVQDMELTPRILAECVYNPHINSAKVFAEKCNINKFTDNWNEFLSTVDAVYIASPHETHVDYAKKALQQKKHILCEKPMAFSRADVEELFDLAESRQVVLMEAVKTAYCPGFQQLMKTARSGVIGEIRDVEACFTKLTDPIGRELSDTVYGGSLTELGTYVLLPIIEIFGEHPKDIQFQSIKDEKGLDLFTKVHLNYEQGFGMGKAGLGVKSEGDLIISGTEGYLYAKSPWWLTKEFEVRFEDPTKREYYTFAYERSGLQYELQTFVEEILSGRAEYEKKRRMSMAFAAVMEDFLRERKAKKR